MPPSPHAVSSVPDHQRGAAATAAETEPGPAIPFRGTRCQYNVPVMELSTRYKRLTLWNKIMVWGALAAFVALPLGVPALFRAGSNVTVNVERVDVQVHVTGQHAEATDLVDVLVGDQTAETVTGADGSYRLSAPVGFIGAIVPRPMPGYRFEPPAVSVANLSEDSTVDFVATPLED